MTSGYQTEADLGNQPARPQQEHRPESTSSESAYERLTGYAFAQQYAKGKVVADLGRAEIGYGSRLLAQSAQAVTALSELPEAVDLASALYPAPNVSYQGVDLPKLPLPEDHFDVVVAFGVIEELERAEDLVVEAKRVLKEGGVLIASTPEKRTDTDGRRGGMYLSEFRGLLERHFGHVRLYRQGAVAGGFVFPASEEATGTAPVESVRLSPSGPYLGAELPTTRSVMAVCSDAAEAPGQERSYLLLDRDRRVFDESEERAEDVELMRGEIRRMEETEVQAFVDAIKVRQRLVRELLHSPYDYRSLIFEEIRYRLKVFQINYRLSIIRGNVHAIKQKGATGLAKGALRRSSALYQRLRGAQKNSEVRGPHRK